jgi:hypothetical protein
MAEFRRQVLRAQARHHVGVAAGRERHHHGDRPARPVQRAQRRGEKDESCDNR